MKFEVEQKFPAADIARIERELKALGAEIGAPVEQCDQYFGHPCRSFEQTDEALRIRRVGDQNFVTYKGPKIDKETKTRREIELPLAPGEEGFRGFAALFEALSFHAVAQVHKQRRKASLTWEGQEAEVALDEVAEVGAFVEIEIVAEEAEVDEAKRRVAAIAQRLGLQQSERRSYLEMLLEKREKRETRTATAKEGSTGAAAAKS